MLWVHRNLAGLTQRVNPNLGKTFEVAKQTTLVSQCVCPFLRHTPPFVMDGGEPAADLWFWSALCIDDLSPTTTLSTSSSRSNTSQWTSRNALIAPSPITSRQTTDSPESSSLHTFVLLCDVNLDITVHYGIHIGRSSCRNAVDCNCIRRQGQISHCLLEKPAFLNVVTTTQRHQLRSQGHW